MNNSDVLAIFKETQAILHGHFILSSGKHSDTYLQCARVLMYPEKAATLCAALTEKVRKEIGEIDAVVAPAMGGVVVGYEMARQLGVMGMFCERVDGAFALRRGFHIEKGMRILMVEDVVTTGKSSLEAMECVRAAGGVIVGEASLIDRSNGTVDLGIPYCALMSLDVATYDADDLPEQLKNIPAVKPGSRWLKAS